MATQNLAVLVEKLQKGDWAERQEAALRLGATGDAQAVPDLVEAMGKGSSAAARALGMIGDPQAIPALVTALGSPDGWVREEARNALERIGQPSAPALIAVLEDENRYVREQAARALGHIRATQAAGWLQQRLGDCDGAVRWAAYQALRQMAPESAADTNSPPTTGSAQQ